MLWTEQEKRKVQLNHLSCCSPRLVQNRALMKFEVSRERSLPAVCVGMMTLKHLITNITECFQQKETEFKFEFGNLSSATNCVLGKK